MRLGCTVFSRIFIDLRNFPHIFQMLHLKVFQHEENVGHCQGCHLSLRRCRISYKRCLSLKPIIINSVIFSFYTGSHQWNKLTKSFKNPNLPVVVGLELAFEELLQVPNPKQHTGERNAKLGRILSSQTQKPHGQRLLHSVQWTKTQSLHTI